LFSFQNVGQYEKKNKEENNLHKSQMNVLNLTQTFPKPIPRWPGVPQLGQIIFASNRRNFFSMDSADSLALLDILFGKHKLQQLQHQLTNRKTKQINKQTNKQTNERKV